MALVRPTPDGLAPVLCVFGTASDVGKSWLTTGICRLFADAGVAVAPYKAQNMSNNAGVTPFGGEMGRAQIVQAEACRLPPHVDMNPLLLKPNSDTGAQVVLLGEAIGTESARSYFSGGMEARRAPVLAALDRLRSRHELVVAEGAGSCAEVNLRDRDLVNFPVAEHAEGPVLLVADIHRGGVFAQVVGTLAVLPPSDRARVRGILINRFRGDPTLFEDGRAWLQQRTGLPILGVVPWSWEARIESEDGLPVDARVDGPKPQTPACVAVLRLPHISNFTDLLALERLGVGVHYLAEPRDLSAYDAVVLPGSKNTRGDLRWLRAQGWDRRLLAHRDAGGTLVGLCGGYQMLGRSIADPHGIEGPPGTSDGLGLLAVRTTMARRKRTSRTRGAWNGHVVAGYEIHVGVTEVEDAPLLRFTERDGVAIDEPDGATSADGRVLGTYLHGLFDEPGAARAFVQGLRPDLDLPELPPHDAWRQRQYDALSEHLRGCLDVDALFGLVG
jgi:adenosylcobyric acid synthase